jgi:hypothetical protein
MGNKSLKVGNHVIEHWQIIAVLLAIYDFVAVCAAYFLALLIRFHSCKFGTMKKCVNVG